MKTIFYIQIVLLSVIVSPSCGEPLCVLLNKKCKRLDSCPTMQAVLKNSRKNGLRNAEHEEYIRQSHCGFEDKMQKVWCPGHCTTPDGRKGECLDLESCPVLQKLNRPRMTYKTRKFLAKYRCAVPKDFFCCPLSSDAVKEDNSLNCSVSATLPPHPESGCCGIAENIFRMIGGEPTNQFTWLALIEYNSKELGCDGSLISKHFVLTSAHCTESQPWRVRLGEYNLQNPAKKCQRTHEYGVEKCSDDTTVSLRIKVKRSIKHPWYKRDHFKHDIALLRMEDMATLNEYVSPVCLPCSDITISPATGLKLFLVGWDSNRTSKQYLYVPYVDLNACKKRYKDQLEFEYAHICAGGEANKSDCAGDSGGPVMSYTGTHFQLVGVITRGPTPCGIEYPSIHTKVFEYLEWIKTTILKHDKIRIIFNYENDDY